MEYMLYQMKNANIIDFKLGKRTYSSLHSEQKKLQEAQKAKDSSSDSLGFRIAGIKIKNKDNAINLYGGKTFIYQTK